jgi:hypothetical protein
VERANLFEINIWKHLDNIWINIGINI